MLSSDQSLRPGDLIGQTLLVGSILAGKGGCKNKYPSFSVSVAGGVLCLPSVTKVCGYPQLPEMPTGDDVSLFDLE